MAKNRTPLIVSIIAALGVAALFIWGGRTRNRALESFRLSIASINKAGNNATASQWKKLETLHKQMPADGDWAIEFAVARYHMLKNESVKALDHLERSKAKLPSQDDTFAIRSARWEIPTFQAKLLRKLDRYDESLTQLETAWSLNKTSRHIALGLAETHFHFVIGDDNKSKDHLEQAELFTRDAMKLSATDKNDSETSDYPDAWNMRGQIRLHHKDYLGARADFRKTLSLQPSHGQALYNLCLASAFLSVEYAKPKDGTGETYRAEALRSSQELKALYPKLYNKLYTTTGFNRFAEGVPLH